ncbi:sigma-70 family RNA polymerase sigma factor [Rossellomorea vietnamensis]|uniref:RNA polymerase sigma factor n=1 Tax=Rossellomorea vietnamensis TaxID=218284 RepID=A0A5D4MJF4_9BACI|nr:sigma-70 family RNA polymerase sigma factor [Rossellomorea vietnamensis]TYS01424.1 sigma-70 family RNA polymerase sigma factor [Rossellomorea vietnamensis]
MSLHLNESEAHALFNEFRDYVFRTALLLTKSRSLADDITQETFIRILTKYHTYDQTKPIKPWIYTITINVTRSIMKKQKWIDRFSIFTENLEDDRINSLEDTFLHNEEAKELWGAVKRLSVKSREILILHFYLELTLRESANVLGIPEGTAKSRLNTALKQLRRMDIKRFSQRGGDMVEESGFLKTFR